MSQEIYDITIIGAGPVGLFTAFYAGMRNAKVKIIDSLEQAGGQPAHLYPEKYIYDIAGLPKVKARDLISQLMEQLSRFDETEFVYGEEALSLEKKTDSNGDEFIQISTDKSNHLTRTIILAAGNGAFSPRKLNIEGAESFEKTNLDYYLQDPSKYQGQKVVILGGGDSAVDTALMLEEYCNKVTVVHRRDRFRALESSVSQMENSSIEVLTPYTATGLKFDGDKITHIILTKARSEEELVIELDRLIVSYGFTSAIGEIRNWGLELERNSIKVNNFMETNLPGVYAVGDIATYPGKVDIIASGFGEAPTAVNAALAYIDPTTQPPTTHSTDLFS